MTSGRGVLRGRLGGRRLAGVAVVVLAVVAVLLGFSTWAVITNPGAPDGTLTGWGGIGGVPDMAGENINEVISSLGGSGSYRPAMLATVWASVAGLAGVAMLVLRRTAVPAGLAAISGLILVLWAGYRALAPGDVAGIVEEGGTRSGGAPWWVAVCGLVIAVASAIAWIRSPASDPPVRVRGIQGR